MIKEDEARVCANVGVVHSCRSFQMHAPHMKHSQRLGELQQSVTCCTNISGWFEHVMKEGKCFLAHQAAELVFKEKRPKNLSIGIGEQDKWFSKEVSA